MDITISALDFTGTARELEKHLDELDSAAGDDIGTCGALATVCDATRGTPNHARCQGDEDVATAAFRDDSGALWIMSAEYPAKGWKIWAADEEAEAYDRTTRASVEFARRNRAEEVT